MFQKLAPDSPISDENLYSVLSLDASSQTRPFIRVCHSSYLPGALGTGEAVALRSKRTTEREPFTLELLSVLKILQRYSKILQLQDLELVSPNTFSYYSSWNSLAVWESTELFLDRAVGCVRHVTYWRFLTQIRGWLQQTNWQLLAWESKTHCYPSGSSRCWKLLRLDSRK